MLEIKFNLPESKDSLESAITRIKTHRLLPPITISDFYMLMLLPTGTELGKNLIHQHWFSNTGKLPNNYIFLLKASFKGKVEG